MKISGSLSLALAVLTYQASAQTLQWAHSINSASAEHTYAVAVDATGAVYSVGYFQTTVDLDPGPGVANITSNSGSADPFIRKVDANGNFLWGRSFGSNNSEEAWSVAVDADNNVVFTGRILGTVDIDPTAGIFMVSATGGSADVFVVKLASDGSFLWGCIFGGAGMDTGYGIATDASGNIYTSGTIGFSSDMDPGPGTTTLGGNGQNDAFVQKLDANGQFIWARAIGGTANDEGWSVDVTPAGMVYFAGEFRNTVDLDPGAGTQNATSAGNQDIFVMKLDLGGALVWAFRFGGGSVETARSITVDATGACIFTGDMNSVTDMDPGAGTFNITGDFTEDAYLAKLNTAGQFEWAFILSGFLKVIATI